MRLLPPSCLRIQGAAVGTRKTKCLSKYFVMSGKRKKKGGVFLGRVCSQGKLNKPRVCVCCDGHRRGSLEKDVKRSD